MGGGRGVASGERRAERVRREGTEMREGMQMRKGVETKEGAVLTNESSEGSEEAKHRKRTCLGHAVT